MQVVNVSSRRHQTLVNPLNRFRRAYSDIMNPSDFRCIESLIEQGHVEVVLDAETRGLELIPHGEAEHFVKMVFESLIDEAAAAAR